MQWFNVSANYDWEKYADLMIDYEVTYDEPNHDMATSSDSEKSLKKVDILNRYL